MFPDETLANILLVRTVGAAAEVAVALILIHALYLLRRTGLQRQFVWIARPNAAWQSRTCYAIGPLLDVTPTSVLA